MERNRSRQKLKRKKKDRKKIENVYTDRNLEAVFSITYCKHIF